MNDTIKPFAGLKKFAANITQVFFIFLIIIGGTVIFHNVYFTPVKIVGASMQPNLYDADFGVMDTNSWAIDKIERFDVVILQPSELVDRYIIKRVIGMPGETVVLDTNGQLFINNNLVEQDFIPDSPYKLATCVSSSSFGCFTPIILGLDDYYVLGDNRGYSSDSRVLGLFNKTQIVGVLFAIEGVCLAANPSSIDPGATLETCSNRSYHVPTLF
jgi:signal peptidase I